MSQCLECQKIKDSANVLRVSENQTQCHSAQSQCQKIKNNVTVLSVS